MHYMSATPISFRWDPEFVRRIDDARGEVKRSTYVRAAVEAALDEPAHPPGRVPAPQRSTVDEIPGEIPLPKIAPRFR